MARRRTLLLTELDAGFVGESVNLPSSFVLPSSPKIVFVRTWASLLGGLHPATHENLKLDKLEDTGTKVEH